MLKHQQAQNSGIAETLNSQTASDRLTTRNSMTQDNGHQPDKLDILIDQVGRLTEVVTIGFQEIKAISQQQSTSIQQQATSINQLADSVQRQEQTISRLVGIVEGSLQERRA
jgi:methyl-accepting chemotaxis protein